MARNNSTTSLIIAGALTGGFITWLIIFYNKPMVYFWLQRSKSINEFFMHVYSVEAEVHGTSITAQIVGDILKAAYIGGLWGSIILPFVFIAEVS